MTNIKIYLEEFEKSMREVLLQFDLETAQLFLDRFLEKLNEQKCTQEDFRTSG